MVCVCVCSLYQYLRLKVSPGQMTCHHVTSPSSASSLTLSSPPSCWPWVSKPNAAVHHAAEPGVRFFFIFIFLLHITQDLMSYFFFIFLLQFMSAHLIHDFMKSCLNNDNIKFKFLQFTIMLSSYMFIRWGGVRHSSELIVGE